MFSDPKFVAEQPMSRRDSLAQRGVGAVLVLFVLLMLSVGAAGAPPKVFGVSSGQTVDGPVVVWAEASRFAHWMSLRLEGPGTSLEAKSSGQRVHLVENASTGQPLAWDASASEPGEYTLSAVSYVRNRPVDRSWVKFRVGAENDVPQTVEGLADPPPSLPQALAPVGGDGDATDTDARRAEARLPRATFNDGAPDALVASVARALPIELDGPMPSGGDVLLLAWDLDRRQMVDAFAHTLTRGPWQAGPEFVAELPTGKIELQLHVRHGRQFVQTDKRVVTVRAASADSRLPRVGFPADAPRTFVRGSGVALPIDVGGALPANADVLVIAWSIGRGELVERFSVEMDAEPYVVPAAQLDRLPEGVVEVQALTRVDNQVKRKATHTLRVVNPTPAPGSENGGDTPTRNPNAPTPDTGSDTPNGGNGNAGGDRSPANPAPTPPTPGSGNPTPGSGNGNNSGDTPPGGDRTPSAPPPTTVSFAPGTPDAYTRGSDTPIAVALDGSLPTDGDVLLIAWHKGQNRLVESFAHTLQGGEREVSNGQLDKLPSGTVELQAHLRLANQTVMVTKRDVRVTVPGEPEPEVEQPTAPEPVAPGSGFNAYPPASGARVIYVSRSGSDANSGLSPNTPLKSPSRGMEMLRDGQPDQLLFKAGDTFSGGLGTLSKSGRSPSQKLVIGVYGDGPRPKFVTGTGNFLSVFNTVRNVAIVGLHGYSNRRDPSSPDYRSGDVPYLATGVAWYGKASDIVFEDMHLEWYKDNFVIQAPNPGDIRNVLLYRVIANNAWCDHKRGHSQGLYAQGVYDMEIVECTFDHNGWRPGRTGDRTKFNHNMYVQNNCKRVDVRRTLVTRGCHNGVQLRGGGDVEDNLFSHNSIGLYLAQEPSSARRNVFLHGTDLHGGYPLGFGLQVLPCEDAKVEDNLFAHKLGTAGWAAAIEIAYRDDIINPPGSYNVELRRNIIADWPMKNGARSISRTTGSANIRVDTGNVLDRASGGDGDPPFIDPTRDLDGYARHVGADNHESLLRAAVNRGRGAWEDRYAAAGAIRWVREGFDYLPYD